MTITNAERAVLRRAIAAHPDWPAYRRTHGCDTSSLGGARALAVAAALGIDAAAVLSRPLEIPAAPATPAIQDAPDMNTPAPAAPAGLFDKRAPAAPAAGGDAVGQALATLAQALAGGDTAGQLAALADRIAALETRAPRLVLIDPRGAEMGELPDTRHPMLETLVKALSARDAASRRLNVWIAGPAGSGKTHGAEQAAKALGLTFGFHGAMSMTHELVGFVDAGGRYHETQFVQRFRNGGLCLLDELDSWSPEATLSLNAALSNGQISLPNGEIIARHADFACVGAANTFGLGATAEYVGRNRLDAAFLSRFAVKLSWGYDADLEQAMCGNPDWARRVQRARAAAAKHGVKAIIDPRASMAGAALIAAGITPDDAARMTYLATLTEAQIAQIEGGR